MLMEATDRWTDRAPTTSVAGKLTSRGSIDRSVNIGWVDVLLEDQKNDRRVSVEVESKYEDLHNGSGSYEGRVLEILTKD